MVYLICFIASVIFAYCAQYSKKKISFIFFSILSIAVTVLLAGLRDISVGTDTSHYFYNLWTEATRSRSLWSFMKVYFKYYSSKEFLYAFLLGTTAKLTGNFNVFLTLVHLIIVGGVYIGLIRLKRYASPPFCLLLFYLFYYNHSLNIIRQYMAMAILFAFTDDLLNRNFKRYLLAVFLAMMMHNSAFLGIIPLILFQILYPKHRMRAIPLQHRIIMYLLMIAAFFMLRPIAGVLIKIGIASQKYIFYLESNGKNSYIVARMLSLIEIIVIFIFVQSFRRYQSEDDFFLACTIAFALLYQIASNIQFGRRIPLYFCLNNICSLGILTKCPKMRGNSLVIQGTIIVVAFAYWVLMFLHYNTSDTIPYILGI